MAAPTRGRVGAANVRPPGQTAWADLNGEDGRIVPLDRLLGPFR